MREWFLIYYNNRKHSTTEIAPYVIMRNVNDQELIQKVITKTEKTRNKMKRKIDNYEKGQIERITNHIQHLKKSDYIIYKPSTVLQKGIYKELCKTKVPYSTLSSPPVKLEESWFLKKISTNFFCKNYAFELSVNKIFLFFWVFLFKYWPVIIIKKPFQLLFWYKCCKILENLWKIKITVV